MPPGRLLGSRQPWAFTFCIVVLTARPRRAVVTAPFLCRGRIREKLNARRCSGLPICRLSRGETGLASGTRHALTFH